MKSYVTFLSLCLETSKKNSLSHAYPRIFETQKSYVPQKVIPILLQVFHKIFH